MRIAHLHAQNKQTVKTVLQPLRKLGIQAGDGSNKPGHEKQGGLSILVGELKEAAETLLDQLGEYGVSTVPGGELESWLKTLGCTGHGPQWLIKVFERMGDDPDDAHYVRPSDDDVWKFIALVRTWLMKPDRKGVPA